VEERMRARKGDAEWGRSQEEKEDVRKDTSEQSCGKIRKEKDHYL
jgi:hypothetical protein